MNRLREFYREHERAALVLLVAAIALGPYGSINHLSAQRPSHTLNTWLDDRIPYVKEWEYVYFGFLLFTLLPAMTIRHLPLLRRAALAYAAIYAVCIPTFLVYPVRMVRWVDNHGTAFVDWGVRLNQFVDGPNNCFPSLHVAVAIGTALCAWKADRLVGAISLVFALLVAYSTLAVKAHYLADVVVGIALAVAIWWRVVRPFDERGIPALAFPRWVPAILPMLFALAVLGIYSLWRSGWQIPKAQWDLPGYVRYYNPATGTYDSPAAAEARAGE